MAEKEINKALTQNSSQQHSKIDTTEKILIELKKMIEEKHFTIELEEEIRKLITKVNSGELNLFDYRKSDSKDKYGEEIVKAISDAHQRR